MQIKNLSEIVSHSNQLNGTEIYKAVNSQPSTLGSIL